MWEHALLLPHVKLARSSGTGAGPGPHLCSRALGNGTYDLRSIAFLDFTVTIGVLNTICFIQLLATIILFSPKPSQHSMKILQQLSIPFPSSRKFSTYIQNNMLSVSGARPASCLLKAAAIRRFFDN